MNKKYRAVVIGASFGGFTALTAIIPRLPKDFIPIIIVVHLKNDSKSIIAEHLDQSSMMRVKEADSDESLQDGFVYIAPPGYHLLIEHDYTLSFTLEEAVNFCCPSVDVLFESAAIAFNSHLIGILLTGANSDGCQGLKAIQERGGLIIAQDPKTAEAPEMPQSAIDMLKVDHVLSIEEIILFLINIHQEQSEMLP